MIIETEMQFPGAQIIIANDRYRKGKGWAVREALKQATGDFICFIDGDMDIHPRMIWRLLTFIDDYDIIVGTKKINGLLSRRILTFLSRIYIKILFNIDVETQTGIKIFKREALLPWKTDSFAFDIEILRNAKKQGFRMIEVPVETNITRKAKFKSIWKCLVDSFKIFLRG
jgi:glycosyltransferase involved in cell wall biosynthesis